MVSGTEFVLIALAAVAAGATNAIAGGGTLITFPVLVAVGVPPIAANITNTVALCPGFFGATLAPAAQLRGQRRRVLLSLPAGALGGVIGIRTAVISTRMLVTDSASDAPDPSRARRPVDP